MLYTFDGRFTSGLLQKSTWISAGFEFAHGYVYPIDRFLTIPENLTATASTLTQLDLTAAIGLMEQLGVADRIQSTGNLTMLLPNNAAFQRVGDALEKMSTEQLTQILEYHIINGSMISLYDPFSIDPATTVQGGIINFPIEGNQRYVNNAQILYSNVLTDNGVFHVIDRVLNPSSTAALPDNAITIDNFATNSATDIPFTSGVPIATSLMGTTDVTPTSLASPKSTSTSASNSSSSTSKSNINVGVIAGGVVGGVCGTALLILALWVCKRKGYSIRITNKNRPLSSNEVEKPAHSSTAVIASDAGNNQTNQATPRIEEPVNNSTRIDRVEPKQGQRLDSERIHVTSTPISTAPNNGYGSDIIYGFEPTPTRTLC